MKSLYNNGYKIVCCQCGKPIKYKKSLEKVGVYSSNENIYAHKGCWNRYINLSTTTVYDLI